MTEYQKYKMQVTLEVIAPDYEEASDFVEDMFMSRYKHGLKMCDRFHVAMQDDWKEGENVTRLYDWEVEGEE